MRVSRVSTKQWITTIIYLQLLPAQSDSSGDAKVFPQNYTSSSDFFCLMTLNKTRFTFEGTKIDDCRLWGRIRLVMSEFINSLAKGGASEKVWKTSRSSFFTVCKLDSRSRNEHTHSFSLACFLAARTRQEKIICVWEIYARFVIKFWLCFSFFLSTLFVNGWKILQAFKKIASSSLPVFPLFLSRCCVCHVVYGVEREENNNVKEDLLLLGFFARARE